MTCPLQVASSVACILFSMQLFNILIFTCKLNFLFCIWVLLTKQLSQKREEPVRIFNRTFKITFTTKVSLWVSKRSRDRLILNTSLPQFIKQIEAWNESDPLRTLTLSFECQIKLLPTNETIKRHKLLTLMKWFFLTYTNWYQM